MPTDTVRCQKKIKKEIIMDKLKEFLKSLPLPLRIIAIIAVGVLILLGTVEGCALKFNASGSADNMSGIVEVIPYNDFYR